ncbi:Ribosome biogenesis protein NOP53 [Sesamum angolense]|uniref:Ribosome biogenesis protein NOP53 n=1 Tax=Sesamum angolense TaxID=2727404 RepID=A0AAE1T7J5_9LAMI|nr:Ribosome biogenesis protein NOP53 [Sesamum angolense]
MGKRAKSSRKGKKRGELTSAPKTLRITSKSTKDALSGGSLADVPSDSLFFVDKSRDLSVKRKIERSREKVLRCDSLLQRNPFVKPIPSSIQKKKKSKKNGKAVHTAKDKDDELGCQGTLKLGLEESAIDSGILDLWEEKGEDNAKIKKDALARAVADEMQKIYQHELGPEPIPLVVPGEVVDEEDKYFLEADGGSDEDVENENQTDNEDADAEKRPLKTKRITRVELNRRARRKEQLRAEAESKKVEELSKDIDSLTDIMQEIAKEDEEKHKRHLRRMVAKQERLKARPPRLGKYKENWFTSTVEGLLHPCERSLQEPRERGLVIPSKKSGRAPLFKVKKHAEYRRLATVKETHTAASGYSSELHNFV